jgi:Cys-rich four helix bundle protein (predicted Tat secretion target)
MNRRELLLSAAALAAAATTSRVFASEHAEHNHQHEMSARNMGLIGAAADCVVKAQACLQHCLVLLGQGDTSMAACAKTATQVEAACAALQKLAAAEAKSLPLFARAAMDVCQACEEECKKTAKHPECKACGEACAACYQECKKIAV